MEPLEWLTLGLLLTTAYYAAQTRATVRAMRDATLAQQMPHLVIQLGSAHGRSVLWIRNEGDGPALDPSLEVRYVPPPASNLAEVKRHVRVTLLAEVAYVSVLGPVGLGDDPLTHDEVCQSYSRVVVTGHVTDSLGNEHEVDRQLEELRPFRQGAGRDFKVEPDPSVVQAELAAEHLGQIHAALRELEKAVRNEPAEDDSPF